MCFGCSNLKNHLNETILLNTRIICLGWEVRLFFLIYAPLSGGLHKISFLTLCIIMDSSLGCDTINLG